MSITSVPPAGGLYRPSALPSATDPAQRPVAPGKDQQGPGFAERLGHALENVNAEQAKATQAARDFETGKTSDLAAVMVEQQVASLGFQITLQVRNKALTAYRDIMNMPV